jgi:hypothetical protein
MPNAELLMKEIQTLPPAYMEEALNFIGYLKQKVIVSHAANPPAPGHKEVDEIGVPAWEFFGLPSPPTQAEMKEALKQSIGIAKDSGFTSDKLLENRRKDKEMEEAKFRQWFHKDGLK